MKKIMISMFILMILFSSAVLIYYNNSLNDNFQNQPTEDIQIIEDIKEPLPNTSTESITVPEIFEPIAYESPEGQQYLTKSIEAMAKESKICKNKVDKVEEECIDLDSKESLDVRKNKIFKFLGLIDSENEELDTSTVRTTTKSSYLEYSNIYNFSVVTKNLLKNSYMYNMYANKHNDLMINLFIYNNPNNVNLKNQIASYFITYPEYKEILYSEDCDMTSKSDIRCEVREMSSGCPIHFSLVETKEYNTKYQVDFNIIIYIKEESYKDYNNCLNNKIYSE